VELTDFRVGIATGVLGMTGFIAVTEATQILLVVGWTRDQTIIAMIIGFLYLGLTVLVDQWWHTVRDMDLPTGSTKT
jgi:hypothetical protein